jgi:beta-glucuronidase
MKLQFVRTNIGSGVAMRAGIALLAVIGALSAPRALQAESAPASSPIVITGADMRPHMSLNGEWGAIVDPYFSGLFSFHHQEKANGWFLNQKAKPGDTSPIEYDFAKAPKLMVPADWNTQRESLFYYEGPVWYERDFTYEPKEHTKIFLHIGAANYRSWFWVNGKKVCEHEGGFTSFSCDVTAAVHGGDNFVVAAVDNTRLEDGVPGLETDWWNYGGLTRAVSLIEVPDAFIDQYDLHLARGEGSTIEGWVHVEDGKPGEKVEVEIPELGAEATAAAGEDGRAEIRFRVSNLERWSPETPKLYKVKVRAGQDAIEDLIGCNFVRLAHYPHDETMLRAADRMGLLVWSENPVYWALQFDNPKVLAKAEQQLDEKIGTSRNHAAIILWSIANETPNTAARSQFIETLASRARALDSSRLITAALLVHADGNTKIVDDPLGKVLDVIGVNEYIGWYEKHPESADITQWRIEYQKPLIVSEFGGDAKAGLHGGDNDRWTEEYQANLYRHQLGMCLTGSRNLEA